MKETKKEFGRRILISKRLLLFGAIAVLLVGITTSVFLAQRYSEQDAKYWVKNEGGHVFYDIKIDTPKPLETVGLPWEWVADYLRNSFGVEFFSNAKGVILDNQFVSDLSPLTKFNELRVLAIYIDILPEANLMVLAELRELETLSIDHTCLTEEQVTQLAEVRNNNPSLNIQIGPNVNYL